jgi:hypothetical protein
LLLLRSVFMDHAPTDKKLSVITLRFSCAASSLSHSITNPVVVV